VPAARVARRARRLRRRLDQRRQRRLHTLLWETELPFSGNGTPAAYDVNGRELIVIAAGGGKARAGAPSGGVHVAFALPAR
jgi:glucose dehydrogenase